MKLFIIIQLFAFCAVECFLTNPFLADNSVKSFLNVVESNSDGNNLMNQAIAGELCNRECKTNDKKVCRFKFMIKFYQAMSGWVWFFKFKFYINSFNLQCVWWLFAGECIRLFSSKMCDCWWRSTRDSDHQLSTSRTINSSLQRWCRDGWRGEWSWRN